MASLSNRDFKLPTISFVVPVYNVEPYVEECLISILNQIDVFPGSEILIADDGSTDGSLEVVNRVAEHSGYAEITILKNSHQGLSMTRNSCLEIAKGDYIWAVDSDDYLAQNALETLKSTMMATPEMDIYVTGLVWKRQIGKDKVDIKLGDILMMDGWKYLTLSYPVSPTQRFIHRTDLIRVHGLHFVPYILHEDFVYDMMLLHVAQTVKILPMPIYQYRLREGSISLTVTLQNVLDVIAGNKELMAYCEKNVKPEQQMLFKYYACGGIIYAYNLLRRRPWKEQREFIYKEGNYVHERMMEIMPYVNGRDKLRLNMLANHPYIYLRCFSIVWDALAYVICYLTGRK